MLTDPQNYSYLNREKGEPQSGERHGVREECRSDQTCPTGGCPWSSLAHPRTPEQQLISISYN